jgi:hypothetical protein
LTGFPLGLVEHVLRSNGHDPEATSGPHLAAALATFGLSLKRVANWRAFEGPTLADWLASRSGRLLGQRLAVLVGWPVYPRTSQWCVEVLVGSGLAARENQSVKVICAK